MNMENLAKKGIDKFAIGWFIFIVVLTLVIFI